jgi:hypothetical protein
MWQDIRVAVRGFRQSPGFTLTALITLTLAIGANTTVFSPLDALVLRDAKPSVSIDQARAGLELLWPDMKAANVPRRCREPGATCFSRQA